MLQLLGYALNLCQPATQKRGLPVTGEYQRLELIRRLLEQTPEKAYTLNELARRAAMSQVACGASFAMPMGVPCLIICAIAAWRARVVI